MLRRAIPMLFLVLFFASPTWAQDAAEPTVTIASKEGAPQSEVGLDVTLAGVEAAQAKSVTVTMDFPRNLLSFARAESKEVKGNRPKVEAKVLKESPNAATLELTISPGMMAETKIVPDGAVATIYFNIAAEAKTETKIPLKATVKAMLGEAAQAKDVKVAEPGTVSVVPSLIFSCFLYMH